MHSGAEVAAKKKYNHSESPGENELSPGANILCAEMFGVFHYLWKSVPRTLLGCLTRPNEIFRKLCSPEISLPIPPKAEDTKGDERSPENVSNSLL